MTQQARVFCSAHETGYKSQTLTVLHSFLRQQRRFLEKRGLWAPSPGQKRRRYSGQTPSGQSQAKAGDRLTHCPPVPEPLGLGARRGTERSRPHGLCLRLPSAGRDAEGRAAEHEASFPGPERGGRPRTRTLLRPRAAALEGPCKCGHERRAGPAGEGQLD